jgi:hypothetical protein
MISGMIVEKLNLKEDFNERKVFLKNHMDFIFYTCKERKLLFLKQPNQCTLIRAFV